MMEIGGTTRVLGIFGHPVAHSLSPLMQNAALEHCGIDMVYLPFDVEEEDLKDAIQGVRAMKMVGVNVTIPHKEAVLPYLDEVSEEAILCGSVNTIHNDRGRLRGFNTDGEGYVRSLRQEGVEVQGRRILIIGAGGAAKGIMLALLKEGPSSITVANRTPSRAHELVERFQGVSHVEMGAIPLEGEGLHRVLEDADLLINATSVGMEGKGRLALPLHLLPKGAVVSDIVYRPIKTALLREAEALGYKVVDGVGMLVEQGALAFEIWTGSQAPRQLMRRVVVGALEGQIRV